MEKQSKQSKRSHPPTRSSMSISSEVICEDDACIGKVADPRKEPLEDSGPQHEKGSRPQPSGTRIAVGGQDVCTEDACIGKQ